MINSEETKIKRDILILLAVTAFVFIFRLGSGSLSSWDEAFYAEVSREITGSGNWIDLTWTGVPWSDKPPLYMWMTACFYKIFGINEFSARFFSAIAGIF
ncbi:MAG: glycosyltransferase family 39 protein, partial [Candidatus Aadella gelida]|nr:glycosyltransferase family 39 protein [Candidatus Aadella gelida]